MQSALWSTGLRGNGTSYRPAPLKRGAGLAHMRGGRAAAAAAASQAAAAARMPITSKPTIPRPPLLFADAPILGGSTAARAAAKRERRAAASSVAAAKAWTHIDQDVGGTSGSSDSGMQGGCGRGDYSNERPPGGIYSSSYSHPYQGAPFSPHHPAAATKGRSNPPSHLLNSDQASAFQACLPEGAYAASSRLQNGASSAIPPHSQSLLQDQTHAPNSHHPHVLNTVFRGSHPQEHLPPYSISDGPHFNLLDGFSRNSSCGSEITPQDNASAGIDPYYRSGSGRLELLKLGAWLEEGIATCSIGTGGSMLVGEAGIVAGSEGKSEGAEPMPARKKAGWGMGGGLRLSRLGSGRLQHQEHVVDGAGDQGGWVQGTIHVQPGVQLRSSSSSSTQQQQQQQVGGSQLEASQLDVLQGLLHGLRVLHGGLEGGLRTSGQYVGSVASNLGQQQLQQQQLNNQHHQHLSNTPLSLSSPLPVISVPTPPRTESGAADNDGWIRGRCSLPGGTGRASEAVSAAAMQARAKVTSIKGAVNPLSCCRSFA